MARSASVVRCRCTRPGLAVFDAAESQSASGRFFGPAQASAQQPNQVRPIGVLMTIAEGDPQTQSGRLARTRTVGSLKWGLWRKPHV